MTSEQMRHEIVDLIIDYAHAIDDDRLEDWPGFFTGDGSYTLMPRASYDKRYAVGLMNCETVGMMKDRVLAYRKANIYEPHRYRHLVGTTRIIGEEKGIHQAETNYAVFRIMQDGTTAIFSTGQYRDELRFEAGRVRFRTRLVLCDSSRVDTLIVIPI